MTYNFYEIHFADPGHEMQSLCNTAQVLSHILSISSLGSIQNEGVSIMPLAAGPVCHDVQSEMREEGFWWQESQN
jgi:hypothetical protein